MVKNNTEVMDSEVEKDDIQREKLGIERSSKLIGRRVQWNPESECAGAGSYGTIVGIQLNTHVVDEIVKGNLDDFHFLITWDSNPHSSMGIFPSDSIIIILEDLIENNIKEDTLK